MKKIICVLLSIVLILNVFSIDSYAKTKIVRKNSGGYDHYYTSENYKYKIYPKSSGVMTVDVELETDEDYGLAICSVWDQSDNLAIDMMYEDGIGGKKRKNFFVRKGKKVEVSFVGLEYGFCFDFHVKKVKIKKPSFFRVQKGKKGYVTLNWKSVSKAKGYAVQVSRSKSFKSNTSQIIVKGTSKTVKLKKNKKYYARVCAYKKVKGVKAFGTWSSKRKIKL